MGPEGKPHPQYIKADSPPHPLEQRGESLGLKFTRGRERTSYSIPSLEAGEFAAEHGAGLNFHKAMFKAYFTDLRDISGTDVLLDVAGSVGLDTDALRDALSSGEYRQQVLDGIEWSRSIGVTAVPTFVFDDQYGVVGAQPQEVLRQVMEQLGHKPKN